MNWIFALLTTVLVLSGAMALIMSTARKKVLSTTYATQAELAEAVKTGRDATWWFNVFAYTFYGSGLLILACAVIALVSW